MIQLPSCSSCGGFVGLALSSCPHCGAQLSRARALAVGMVAAVAGGAVSMTLMACYGMSCADANCGEPDASGDASDGGKDSASKDAALEAASDATTDGATTDASGDASSDASSDSAADAATD